MKNNKIPHLLDEGLMHIAKAGYESVFEDMLEEYGEKLKENFISQMKSKLHSYVTVLSERTFDDLGITLKIEVDVKGVDIT